MYIGMVRYRALLFLVLLQPLAVAQTDADRLHKLFADYYENGVRNFPEAATSLAQVRHDDRRFGYF